MRHCDDSKRLKITLHKERIFRDIDVMSYKMSESTAQDGVANDNIASDVDDPVDHSVMANLLDTNEAALRKLLTFCLKGENVTEIDNADDSSDDYIFDIIMPECFKTSTLKVAMTLMHNYLVKTTLRDWYTSAGSNLGDALAEEIHTLESKIVMAFRMPEVVKTESTTADIPTSPERVVRTPYIVYNNYKLR